MINKKLQNVIKFVVGIDEVGRGPLAGPVTVCAFVMPIDFNAKNFGKIKDSKKLKFTEREENFCKLKELKKNKKVNYAVSFESSRTIDKIGIVPAIKKALEKTLEKLKLNPKNCQILLDGGLKAPDKYKNQKTIIKGDEKERVIAFASIVAKVSRDTLMCRLAKKYPNYCFEVHKGYGTKKHYEKIKKYGICKEHRKCFLKKMV
ncbi:MAG: ribonuclease HII [Minisyncoccia bacterium]